MDRFLLFATFVLFCAGCTGGQDAPATSPEDSAPRVLTADDLERFLTCIQNHSERVIPDFSPPDDDAPPDPDAPAAELVASFREECRQMFDAGRQGAIWQRDPDWSQALSDAEISATRFAALVRDVSLAVMRVRLDARVDVDKLVAQARRQVDRTMRTMEEIDEVPATQRTREAVARRTRCFIRLGRAVALLEFAELVKKVPPESITVVRRYSRQLKPLLPASNNEELLAELKNLATGRGAEIEPAGYETPDEDE